jgi:type II secretory pathway predicted ATPase ExeA
LSEIGKDVEIIRIFQTQLNEIEFLQAMLFELGVEESEMTGLGKVQLLHRLNHYLLDTYSRGRHVVLIVDEGQNLSTKVLEEIRMLSGLEVEKEKLLNIILVGQPEMNEILDQPRMAQLVQRIRLRFDVGSLKQDETIEYIQHRLKVAGSPNPELVFDEDTYPVIQEYAGGIPRKINILCDTAMVCAFADDKPSVDSATLFDALAELQWKPHSETLNILSEMEKKSDPTATPEGQQNSTLPSFNVNDQHWHDLFSSLLRVMGDVTNRMHNIDKKLDKLHKRMDRVEANTQKSNIAPLNVNSHPNRRSGA